VPPAVLLPFPAAISHQIPLGSWPPGSCRRNVPASVGVWRCSKTVQSNPAIRMWGGLQRFKDIISGDILMVNSRDILLKSKKKNSEQAIRFSILSAGLSMLRQRWAWMWNSMDDPWIEWHGRGRTVHGKLVKFPILAGLSCYYVE
jgi:hypothetical protein